MVLTDAKIDDLFAKVMVSSSSVPEKSGVAPVKVSPVKVEPVKVAPVVEVHKPVFQPAKV